MPLKPETIAKLARAGLTVIRSDPEASPRFRPVFISKIAAGFPSPADDYVERRLDLNQHCIHHPEATFFLRVSGHSMNGAGIYDNDILVVDRSLKAVHGKIVVAILDGEFTVKRLFRGGGAGSHLALLPENGDYPRIEIGEGQELEIWGVATFVIHAL
ncbi:DNA polymerase V, subunit D [Acidithiobacillus ferrivorans]|uniref:DNA polymerase V, subunit D n=1 Tax=Acidithiobacillus ferrivorans TaxID=160808 RepID=A0A060UQ14_9PROT|nr:translesion error-prone DNA polymerase V autoproteolytic subunit [Acidithiobacillus ferrivorans]CDQ10485.1 DNA polymerase V, subunit D [Acidithiobacillus ferrivorans]SMH64515.1 DNA polymerase V, subunit D [Acidithiobacillus ferrivorans]